MSLVTVSISGHRSREDLTIIGTHIANALIKGGARVERDFGNVETTWDVGYADTPPSLPQDDLHVTIEQTSYEPRDDAPAQEDDELVNTQMAIFEALVDYSDEAKLGLLSYAAAEVIAEYAEGEDRDAMIELFAQSVEQDIQFHDDYEEDMADSDGEPFIGEVLDVVADQMFAQAPVELTKGWDRAENRDTYRRFVNHHFDLDLPLYYNAPAIGEQADDVCADCGCAMHD